MSSKGRTKRVVRVIKHSFEGGVEQLLDRMHTFAAEWEKRLHNWIQVAGQEFGKLWANQQAMSDSIEQIDDKTLVTAEILRELFTRVELVDQVLDVPVDGVDMEAVSKTAEATYTECVSRGYKKVAEMHRVRNEQIRAAKEAAELAAKDMEWDKKIEDEQKKLDMARERGEEFHFNALELLGCTDEEFIAYKQRKQVREEHQKLVVAEAAKIEADTAESALREAEAPSLQDAQAGGQGSDIPEGAQVFGG